MAKLADDIEQQIDLALATARDFYPDEVASSVTYLPSSDLFLLTLQSGQRIAIPREDLQDVADLSVAEAAEVNLTGLNTVVEWIKPNISFSVKGLADGGRGNQHWMKRLTERRSPAYAA